MNALVRQSVWFNRLVLAGATILFSLIGIRYIADPVSAVAPHQITLGSSEAITIMRVSGGVFFGISGVLLASIFSQRRLLGGIGVLAIVSITVTAVRLLGLAVDGPAPFRSPGSGRRRVSGCFFSRSRHCMSKDAEIFESHRPVLLALAYRMLGELGRAEDAVQEAWMRWQKRTAEVDSPKAYLIKVVTRLCLNELDSARARREEGRADRLPEPITLDESGVGRVEVLDQISMAFLVVLQRLSPAERAVFLLHEVFDFSHAEIAELLGKTDAASRQLLSRARQNVEAERRKLNPSSEEHRRLLRAFIKAATAGEVAPRSSRA